MVEKFLYRKLNELLTSIAKDLNANGAMIIDMYGLPIAKYTDNKYDNVDYLLKFITWTIITLDKLIFNSVGEHRKVLIVDIADNRVIVRQIESQSLKCYLSIVTPVDIPIGIVLFESEFVEKELNKIISGNKKSRHEEITTKLESQGGTEFDDGIRALLDKIEKHPLFKLLSSTGRRNE